MNVQEALKIINQNLAVAIHDNDGANPECEQEQIHALAMAAKAFEKQLPKKPPVIDELYHCPSCGGMAAIMQGDNYCFNCGQALDWGDTK